jgi:peptide/nickel transport system substrate-binding protein
MLIAMISVLMVPAVAQDDLPEGAGEGGIIFESTFADDPATFNPLLTNDTLSSQVTGFLFPAIIGIDPETLLEAPNVDGALATGWEYDETGTILTITLREDAFWNDGTPITAHDYVYSTNVVRSGTTTSPRTYVFAELADGSSGGGKVQEIVALDDYTVQVTFTEPDCIAFSDLNDIAIAPSHDFEATFGEDFASMDADPRRIPPVSFGMYKDIEFAPGQRISMIADQTYPDTQLGYVSPSEYVLLQVPDQTVEVERFIAGDISFLNIPSARQGEFRDNPDFQVYEYSQNGFQWMGYNLANPANPLPGLDEEGNPVEQDPHPIFADVRVRQALAHAVDIDAMIDGILEGNGIRALTHNTPLSWVQPELEPYEFNPQMALDLLAEAGWVDDDGDTSTPLVCQGCWYAENVDAAFEGSPFEFSLETNAGNVAREQIGQVVQSQLGDIGVSVNFEAIDFAVLVDKLTGQTFDAIIIGWSLGLPVDPDVSWAYGPEADLPGSGFNAGSFNSEELNQLLADARNPEMTNGCEQEARAALYEQALTILYEEQPYMYLYIGNVMYAAQTGLENWDPLPGARSTVIWNMDAWSVDN